jgi:3D (Asp-Asp-Asp) domain-containing protein
MTVTAYSPDWRSCGDSADGRTATMHCVTTNAHLLIAADPEVLAYGSMLTVPGYGLPLETKPRASAAPASPAPSDSPKTLPEEPIVPVLDCGGAIKGYRLDVLFPTHEEAIAWGVRELPVTVWTYADGGGHTNPRKVR